MKYITLGISNRKKSNILALGAQAKSSFCLVKGNLAYVAEESGDLSDLRNLEVFQRRIKTLEKKLKFKPKIIACDLHPEYTSTKLAKDIAGEDGLELKAIQHHEAHIASSIVDNKIKGDVIGVAFDGTGFGRDANIWGGEFFIGSLKGFKRASHLEYVPMPGGEAAVREPWRMAVSFLRDSDVLGIMPRLDKGKVKILQQVMAKGINSPLTSSMGRLFDAVSSILGICDVAGYEAQAAIELERICSGVSEGKNYNFDIIEDKGIFIISADTLIKEIIKDLKKRVSKDIISAKFHNGVANMIKDVCILLKKRYKICKVILSGGVFQNRFLTRVTKLLLEKQGFKVYLHNRVPTHDGGIALGQVAIVAASI